MGRDTSADPPCSCCGEEPATYFLSQDDVEWLKCSTCATECKSCGKELGAAKPDARGWCPGCVSTEEA